MVRPDRDRPPDEAARWRNVDGQRFHLELADLVLAETSPRFDFFDARRRRPDRDVDGQSTRLVGDDARLLGLRRLVGLGWFGLRPLAERAEAPPGALATLWAFHGRPVVTTSRAIYLVSNLFEQATLRKAFEREGPRFVAVCRAKLREPSGAVGIRFARSGPFDMQSDLWVADIQSCVGP